MDMITKLIKKRYSISTTTAIKIFIGSGLVLALLVIILQLTATRQFKEHVNHYNSNYVKSIVTLLERSIGRDLTFLKNEANKTTIIKAVMDPANSSYYLPDYLEKIRLESYKALFTLITFDGMIIYTTDSSLKGLDFINRYDEWIGEEEIEERLHIYNGEQLCFTTAVFYNGNIEGYLLTEVNFAELLAHKLSYVELEEQQMSISAYLEERELLSLGPVLRDNLSSEYVMSILPVVIKVSSHRETIDKPVSRMQSQMLIQGAAAIIIATLGLTFFLGRNLIKPILRLSRAVNNIEQGGWVEVPETRRSAVELEELRIAFNRMQSSLRRRSQELEESNRELSRANKELKSTQKRLIQSEKMASVGQLAAGVAHEINNPTAFVMSNISTLSGYVKVFKSLISLLQELKESLSTRDERKQEVTLQAITRIEEEEYLSFIMDDIDTLLDESVEGTVRIKEIVRGLRIFAHSDQESISAENINDAIEAAIAIVLNRIKYCCEIEVELTELPPFPCNLNQITQVFVNLLVNAADAIKERGVIRIISYLNERQIVIEVQDNGSGIPPEMLEKIFDPFFTTKEIGQGTGLGLSISQGILERHGASIEAASELGKGTTFTITLPLPPNNKDYPK